MFVPDGMAVVGMSQAEQNGLVLATCSGEHAWEQEMHTRLGQAQGSVHFGGWRCSLCKKFVAPEQGPAVGLRRSRLSFGARPSLGTIEPG